MPEHFKTVGIYVFDVHTSLLPVSSKKVPPPLGFLVDAEKYRQAYAANQPVVTKSFRIAPLHPITIKKHLFWAGYSGTPTGAPPDYWAIQMPFVCRPTKTNISLETAQGLKAIVTTSIYLFTLGWATTLEFSFVQQKVSTDSLTQLSTAFRSGEKIFRIDGREAGLTDLFKWFSQRITSECFQGFQKNNDWLRVPRYVVMGLANSSSPAEAYQPGSETGMTPETRALMHSMLLGREVKQEEIIELEKTGSQGFLLARLRNLDFAITYFDEGTLLVIQDTLNAKDEQVFACFESNIKNFLLMVKMWLSFQIELQRLAPGQASTELSLINPDTQLRELKQRYPNRFAKAYYAAHSKLKDYP